MSDEIKQFCISARDRKSGFTEDITGPMAEDAARLWQPTALNRHHYVYFKVSKYPFKKHKKGGHL